MCSLSSAKCASSGERFCHRTRWNCSTKMTNINGSLYNGSLDALPRTDETPGMPIKSFEKKTNKISTTNVNINNNNNNNNCINDTHCIAGVKLYGIWTKKLAKDQVGFQVFRSTSFV